MANTNSLSLASASSQYAHIISTDANLNPTGNFTVECWVNPSAIGTAMCAVVNVGTSDAVGPIYKIIVNADGTITGQTWSSGGGFLNVNSTGTISANTWSHLAFVKYAANDWKIYINGTNDGSSTSSRTISATDETGLRIGANESSSGSSNPGGIFFNGKVDDVRIWSTARTSSEINNNKSLELVGNESGLVGYWKLNNAYTDSTANAYTLTAVNSPTFSTNVPFTSASSPLLLLGVG